MSDIQSKRILAHNDSCAGAWDGEALRRESEAHQVDRNKTRVDKEMNSL